MRAYEKASRALPSTLNFRHPTRSSPSCRAVDRRYEQAIASAQKAVSLGPANAEAHMVVAYVQLVWGNHADAAAGYRARRSGTDPNPSAIDRYTAGMVSYLQRDYNRAIDSFNARGLWL